jgi:hypothetical protein
MAAAIAAAVPEEAHTMNTPVDGERFERPSEVLVREVGDEMVLLNTASEQYHSLNDVGRRCYELLGAGASIEETVAAICGEYDVDATQARSDIEALLPELVGSGLLRASS